jgi:hypothetical protein
MNTLFTIVSMLIMASSAFAETKKSKYEISVNRDGFKYECHQENCIEDFPNLIFDETTDRKEVVAFNAEFVTKEGDALIFTNPRISKTLISPETTVCLSYKKNFFGYDICQELVLRDIRSSLCRKLGLGDSDNSVEQGLKSYNTAPHPFLYRFILDKDYWSLLRLGSLLLPSTNFTAINKLKCLL